MIRVVHRPAATFATALLLLFPCIAGMSVVRAQTVTEDKPAADDTVSILASSELLPAEPIRKDERNEYSGVVYSVRFSPDGKTLATGWGDGTIRIWDVATRENTADFVIPRAKGNPEEMIWVRSVAFSPDGKTLASANDGSTSSGMIRLWDLASGKNIAAFNGQTGGGLLSGIYCVVYRPDGKTLASGHEDNVIRVWDAASGKIVKTFQVNDDDAGYSVAFSPDGETLASGGRGGTITLWDMSNNEKIRTIHAVGSGNFVRSLVYSPDGKTLGAACWLEGGGMLWHAANGMNTAQFKPDRVYSEAINDTNDMTSSVAFSPDGRTFAQGCDNGLIVLWNVSSRAMTAVLYGHTDNVRTLDFSPDGHSLVSGANDGTVRLWKLKEP